MLVQFVVKSFTNLSLYQGLKSGTIYNIKKKREGVCPVTKIDQFELGKLFYHDWKQQKRKHGVYDQLRELGREHIDFKLLKKGFKAERERMDTFDFKNSHSEAFYDAVDEVGTQYFPRMEEFVTVKVCYGYGIVFSVDLHAEIGTPDEVLQEKALAILKEYMPTPEQVDKTSTYLEEKRAWLKIEREEPNQT